MTGQARSKKEAKQEAARKMLIQLNARGQPVPPPFATPLENPPSPPSSPSNKPALVCFLFFLFLVKPPYPCCVTILPWVYLS